MSPHDPTPASGQGYDGDLEGDLHAAAMENPILDDDDSGGINWGMMIGLLVAMAAIVFIVMDGLKAETYFFAVDEAVAQGNDLIGASVRIKGTVETGSITSAPGKLGHTFRIAEQGKTMAVRYDKALPDTFQEGSEIVAQGKINANFVLEADEVLVKCPSRYEGQPPTGAAELAPSASR